MFEYLSELLDSFGLVDVEIKNIAKSVIKGVCRIRAHVSYDGHQFCEVSHIR